MGGTWCKSNRSSFVSFSVGHYQLFRSGCDRNTGGGALYCCDSTLWYGLQCIKGLYGGRSNFFFLVEALLSLFSSDNDRYRLCVENKVYVTLENGDKVITRAN